MIKNGAFTVFKIENYFCIRICIYINEQIDLIKEMIEKKDIQFLSGLTQVVLQYNISKDPIGVKIN